MRRGLLASVLLTCLICFGALIGVIAAGWSPLLGLDLQGGLEVVYQPVGHATQAQLDTVVDIMTDRAEGIGLASPNIQTQGNTVVVQLPGVKDPNKVFSVLGNTAQLFFRPVLCYAPAYAAASKPTSTSSTTTTTRPPHSANTTTTAPGTTTTSGGSTTTSSSLGALGRSTTPAHLTSFERPAAIALTDYTETATTTTTTAPATTTTTAGSTTTTGGATTTTTPASTTTTAPATTTTTTPANQPPGGGKAPKDGFVAPPPCSAASRFSVATYDTSTQSNPGPTTEDAALATAPTTTSIQDLPYRTVLINAGAPPAKPGSVRLQLGPTAYDGTTPASGQILSGAQAQLSSTGEWVVNFQIKSQYSAFFNEVAKENYHLPLAIDLGAFVVSYPTINTQNFNGSGQITGDFTQAQASSLALTLEYGQLPVHMTPETVTTVSPSLGKASLRAGLLAGLLGLLLVMGYTIFYYRALGLVVLLGLVTTGALIYAIISFLGQKSGLTLDLSGVTGLIVSVGITVDSYVVYFERLKDEVRAGRSVRSSVDRGFQSAFRTILSADAVSFLGAAVLYFLSIGSVKGFAFMLGLSTLIDVLTAYFFTRPLVILLGRNPLFTEARGLGVARGLAVSPEATA